MQCLMSERLESPQSKIKQPNINACEWHYTLRVTLMKWKQLKKLQNLFQLDCYEKIRNTFAENKYTSNRPGRHAVRLCEFFKSRRAVSANTKVCKLRGPPQTLNPRVDDINK